MRLHPAIHSCHRITLLLLALILPWHVVRAADKLIGFYSARTMSQAMPWIAEEAGLFRKYDLEFQLVYISSAPMVTARLPEKEQPSTVAVRFADVAARMLIPLFPLVELLFVIEQLGP